MLAFDGSSSLVFNPYSLAQLRERMKQPVEGSDLDTYLQCIATSTSGCTPPTDPVFVRQQVRRMFG